MRAKNFLFLKRKRHKALDNYNNNGKRKKFYFRLLITVRQLMLSIFFKKKDSNKKRNDNQLKIKSKIQLYHSITNLSERIF